MSRSIAIDPGYDRVGIAVFEDTTLLHSECFSPESKEFSKRLVEIKKHLVQLFEQYEPCSLAIEALFFNKNQKTAIKVAEARGTIQSTAAEYGLSIHEYAPQTVKIAVTGSGNADKKAVMKMVKRLVELPKGEKRRYDDELDAVALGITHSTHLKLSTKLSTGS